VRAATQPDALLTCVRVGMPMATFEELFDREFTRLVRALGVAFGDAEAADAVQEAFIAADRRWWRIEGYGDPAGWLRRVAVNRLLNGQRDRRRRSAILATIRSVEVASLDESVLDLRRAVAALPDRMRAAVCLHYLADLPVAEVAAALGVAPGTVKSALHEARQRLRMSLEVTDG
jgi:RNA polymerase sigma-70 factor (ECF subfamily)